MKKKLLTGLLVLLPVIFFIFGQFYVKAVEGTIRTETAEPGDNASDLQRLLDYNKYNTYQLTVKIPAGTYLLDKELRVYSNTTIIADPKARLLKNHLKGGILANDLTHDKGGYNTTENITVMGGIWDSSRIQNLGKGTEGFRFIHASNVIIKDATLCNVPGGSHLITFGGVKNGSVDNCTLYGYAGNTLKEAIQIDIVHNNKILPSMQSKILVYDDLPCDGISITNCNIYDYPRAIGSHTSVKGVFHKNIVISGNQLHDLSEAAVKAFNYVNLEISNNTIKNAGLGILAYTYINNQYYLDALTATKQEPLPDNYNIVIKNNRIEDIKEYQSSSGPLWGDGIRTIGNPERPLTGVTIENNTIGNTARYGMFLEGTVASNITANTITGTQKNGIYLVSGSNSALITENILTNTGAKGSTEGGIGLAASSQAAITKNSISVPGKTGIFLYNQSISCTVTYNTVSSPGDCGIAIYQQSNDAAITGNKISGYQRYGIYAYQLGSGTINENKIKGSNAAKNDDGIHITGDNSSVNGFSLKKNIIRSSSRNGIYISNAPGSYIGDNVIADTANYGIYVGTGSKGSILQNNSITGTGKLGSLKNGIGFQSPGDLDISKNKVLP